MQYVELSYIVKLELYAGLFTGAKVDFKKIDLDDKSNLYCKSCRVFFMVKFTKGYIKLLLLYTTYVLPVLREPK